MLGRGDSPLLVSSTARSRVGILETAVGGGQSLALARGRRRLQYFGQRRVEESVCAKLRQACRQATPSKSDRITVDSGLGDPQHPTHLERRSSKTNRKGGRVVKANRDLKKLHDGDKQPADASAKAATIATERVALEAQHIKEMQPRPVLLGNLSSAHRNAREVSEVVWETEVAYLKDIEMRLANELMTRPQTTATGMTMSEILGVSALETPVAPWQLDEHITPWLSISDIGKQAASHICPTMPLRYTRLRL